MKTLYIGAKFDGHDSAIFLILPKEKQLYGLATERLTRQKHDDIFPIPTLERLIGYAGIDPATVATVRFANSFSSDRDIEYPFNKLELDLASRKMSGVNTAADVPDGRTSLDARLRALRTEPTHSSSSDSIILADLEFKRSGSEIWETLHQCMKRHLRRLFPAANVSVRHHDHEYCHALSSYYFSSFDSALVVTMDGAGDHGIFSRAYIARSGVLKPLGASVARARISDPADPASHFSKLCSVGGIYSYFTHKLGFAANCDEGKVEALAALGISVPEIYDRLVSSVRFNDVSHSIEIDASIVREAISHPRLQQPESIGEKADLAATVQRFTEEVVVSYVKQLVSETGESNICLSGGVFANVILNMKIVDQISNQLFVTPAVGDDGSAQGAAVAELLRDGHTHEELRWLRNEAMPYFGTSYSRPEVYASLTEMRDDICFADVEQIWPEKIAELIHAGEIGAIFQGRMEWGPRALGNRSILVSPINPGAREIVNGRVKRRPFYQPVCPSILADEMDRLFEHAYQNKHMTCAFRVRQMYQPLLPGAIHVDGTARVQFVNQPENPTLFRLLVRLRELSGYGVVLNTSFNMHGRTIVESPADALRDFLDMGLDFLVIEGYLVTRAKSN